ncbi:Cof-type HAD-IIB family hydrolase [Pokkaliibacter plantistimulans]|uniref:Cof-type HAD-IIB family hydrolase n=1 Tax=Proteobacteria bacterium 228 TaxID=2083153 RepID=A0A2S5KSW4_9PROT|nr:HAD family hydrolase [Pokkaliibacter plantistimulans]PPC77838.1 Cof-type HAD-IIB family hydrolase [Pokkaliibacter plantistimulans]
MTPPSLIVSDLDKTLLNEQHELDELTIATLRELHHQGHTLALASGRHFHDISVYRAQLGVPAYIISTNGAHLYTPEDTPLFETLLHTELAQQITRLPLPAGVSVSLYTRHKWLIDRPLAELSELHDGTGFSFEVVDIPAYSDNDIGKVLYAGAPEQLKILEDAIRAGFEGQIHMTYSQPMYLEIMGKGVNKGLALQALLHELGLDRQHCYAFGDNLNDVEMLSLAGNAHVMANAHPYLADNLPHATVIGHHNDKAVARQLRSLFALED